MFLYTRAGVGYIGHVRVGRHVNGDGKLYVYGAQMRVVGDGKIIEECGIHAIFGYVSVNLFGSSWFHGDVTDLVKETTHEKIMCNNVVSKRYV